MVIVNPVFYALGGSYLNSAMLLTSSWTLAVFSLWMQFNVQRVSFDEIYAIETLEQAQKALQNVLDRTYACLAYAD